MKSAPELLITYGMCVCESQSKATNRFTVAKCYSEQLKMSLKKRRRKEKKIVRDKRRLRQMCEIFLFDCVCVRAYPRVRLPIHLLRTNISHESDVGKKTNTTILYFGKQAR